MHQEISDRLHAKTPQQRLRRVLEDEFHYAPKVAQAVVDEAQACLWGTPGHMQPGQVRVILTRRAAGHGRALRQTASTEVVWTLDAGADDRQVLHQHGRTALRQVRRERLLDEALDQGAVATQEDLAQVLHVALRTIKRDCAALLAQGIVVPTRGKLQGIGRGQTHKAQIVGRWLRGETYDQIAIQTHHCLTSVQRYVQTFARVMELERQGFALSQIALLLALSEPLVQEYLAVARQHDSPACRERLAAQLDRLAGTVERNPQPQRGGR